ncbi:MAG TPA: hypothetical protein VHA52_12275, partial [Candidatus Babeliaceae bacterium]|nr:hypothetical protein [Candidatus Babeliaceae bacterium]
MKKVLFVWLIGLHLFYVNAHYQDIIINGKVVAKGSRECESRYQAIEVILKKYKRPITMLDIGASEGFFSFRAAQDGATCVMIEGNYASESQESTADNLEQLCEQNTNLSTIMLLKKNI